MAFFEIIGPDHERAQKFYAELFGWEVAADPAMGGYGLVDTGADWTNIRPSPRAARRRLNASRAARVAEILAGGGPPGPRAAAGPRGGAAPRGGTGIRAGIRTARAA